MCQLVSCCFLALTLPLCSVVLGLRLCKPRFSFASCFVLDTANGESSLQD